MRSERKRERGNKRDEPVRLSQGDRTVVEKEIQILKLSINGEEMTIRSCERRRHSAKRDPVQTILRVGREERRVERGVVISSIEPNIDALNVFVPG